MFQSPYSSDSDHEEYFSHKFPFYTSLAEPLVYYTEVKTANDTNNKHYDKNNKRYGFVRAFNCYTEDLTKKKGSIFRQSPQEAEAHFAKWLDEKYQEYLIENTCCKPLSQATNVAYNEPSAPGYTTKNNRKKSPWYKRRSAKTAKENNINEQIEFILKPTSLLRPSSDCNHPSISSANRSCTTIVIKSHSCCMQQSAQNTTPQLGASTIGEGSVPDTIQKMKNGAVGKVGDERTHVNMKDAETQYSRHQTTGNAATQCGNRESPDCVYRFIKQVTEKPLMAIKKNPEEAQKKSKEKLNKFRNVVCQCYKGNSQYVQTDINQYSKSKNKAKTKVDKCCCPYEMETNETANLMQTTTPNYKNVPTLKPSNTSCVCPCRANRGSCFKYQAIVICNKKHNASQTMTGNDNELPTPNSYGPKREPTLRTVACYPIITQDEKSSVAQAQAHKNNTSPQSTKLSSQVPGIVDQQVSTPISKFEANVQTSDHSILFYPDHDHPQFLRITCPDELHNINNN